MFVRSKRHGRVAFDFGVFYVPHPLHRGSHLLQLVLSQLANARKIQPDL